MTKRSPKSHAVVPGLEPRGSELAPAAPQSVRRSRRCPIHRDRPATIEVSIGVVTMMVCDGCGAGIHHSLGAFEFLKGFFP
jgi:hypothetical protein